MSGLGLQWLGWWNIPIAIIASDFGTVMSSAIVGVTDSVGSCGLILIL